MHSNNQRFAHWMEIEGLKDIDVARRMEIDVAYIWRIRLGKRAVADAFAWKFGKTYGFDLAQKLFRIEREPA